MPTLVSPVSPDIVDIVNTSNEELTITLKRFWDLEIVGIVTPTQEETEMTPPEKIVREKVEQSLTYNGAWYEVTVP